MSSRRRFFSRNISYPWLVIVKKASFVAACTAISILVSILLFLIVVFIDLGIFNTSGLQIEELDLFLQLPQMTLTMIYMIIIPFFVLFVFLASLYESTADPTLERSWVFGVRKTVEFFLWPMIFLFISLLVWGVILFITLVIGGLIHTDLPLFLVIPIAYLFIILEPFVLLIGFLIALIKFVLDFVTEIKRVK